MGAIVILYQKGNFLLVISLHSTPFQTPGGSLSSTEAEKQQEEQQQLQDNTSNIGLR